MLSRDLKSQKPCSVSKAVPSLGSSRRSGGKIASATASSAKRPVRGIPQCRAPAAHEEEAGVRTPEPMAPRVAGRGGASAASAKTGGAKSTAAFGVPSDRSRLVQRHESRSHVATTSQQPLKQRQQTASLESLAGSASCCGVCGTRVKGGQSYVCVSLKLPSVAQYKAYRRLQQRQATSAAAGVGGRGVPDEAPATAAREDCTISVRCHVSCLRCAMCGLPVAVSEGGLMYDAAAAAAALAAGVSCGEAIHSGVFHTACKQERCAVCGNAVKPSEPFIRLPRRELLSSGVKASLEADPTLTGSRKREGIAASLKGRSVVQHARVAAFVDGSSKTILPRALNRAAVQLMRKRGLPFTMCKPFAVGYPPEIAGAALLDAVAVLCGRCAALPAATTNEDAAAALQSTLRVLEREGVAFSDPMLRLQQLLSRTLGEQNQQQLKSRGPPRLRKTPETAAAALKKSLGSSQCSPALPVPVVLTEFGACGISTAAVIAATAARRKGPPIGRGENCHLFGSCEVLQLQLRPVPPPLALAAAEVTGVSLPSSLLSPQHAPQGKHERSAASADATGHLTSELPAEKPTISGQKSRKQQLQPQQRHSSLTLKARFTKQTNGVPSNACESASTHYGRNRREYGEMALRSTHIRNRRVIQALGACESAKRTPLGKPDELLHKSVALKMPLHSRNLRCLMPDEAELELASQLAAHEKAALHQLFKEVDLDGDGRISAKDIAKAMAAEGISVPIKELQQCVW
ncbi:hypothetical protein cyc_00133 [Cyclospora cayetanensis]|uniref:EF-hand domain-containing protein n=1 Tax=Cyclospora cayetanensis TaxID=88456 RepID=A0A1D3D9X0_9EIME|nr:hypothetical protein cyc_00133 [Cyclospora cayetanensis]